MISPVFVKPSAKAAPTFATARARQTASAAFSTGAQTYHDIRPGYPAEIALLASADGNPVTVADGGAGTGQFSSALAQAKHQVYAFDPSEDMLRVLRGATGLPAWRARAEATGLATDSVECLSYAQTWHWVDTHAACAEADRVIKPGGRIVLVWNTLDVTRPEILRLARIMHSGDIHSPGFVPTFHAPWKLTQTVRTTMEQNVRVDDVHRLMHTRSYWRRASQTVRNRLTGNLDWYLLDYAELSRHDTIVLPYRTDAFVLERAI